MSEPVADNNFVSPSAPRKCPDCGEDNPVEAVMCWKCYAPSGNYSRCSICTELIQSDLEKCPWCGAACGKNIFIQRATFRAKRWLSQTDRRLSEVNEFFFIAGIALLVPSGWMGNLSVPLLLAGIACWFLAFVVKQIQAVRATRKENKSRKFYSQMRSSGTLDLNATGNSDTELVLRIIGTILNYGVKDGADQIRITAGTRGVYIESRIGAEWQTQMKVPAYVWPQMKVLLDWMANVPPDVPPPNRGTDSFALMLDAIEEVSPHEPGTFHGTFDNQTFLFQFSDEPIEMLDRRLIHISALS